MPSEAAHIFEERLAALQRADRLCSCDGLARLLNEELLTAAGDHSKYSLDGPDVALHPDWAFGLSLVFHELATNAARHGSLSADGGHVDVSWHVESGDLVLTWMETGGPHVRAPSSPGIGSLLVAHAAVKLKGSATLTYFQSGLRCDVRVSLFACWPRRRGAFLLGCPEPIAPPPRLI